MKVNLKKIGAFVAGATILASSVGFAGLMFGDTTLVDDNGAPVAKVVLGSKAAASDGVAASLIAGKMVSEAYATQELTAEVKGTAASDCGESEDGTGTCEITNEKVKLQIKVPGSVTEGTYTVNNLIGDVLNRRLIDRVANSAGVTTTDYPLGTSDVADTAHAATDGSSTTIGPSEHYLYRITGDMFSPFATTTVTDDDAGKTYKEAQNLWLKGDNHYDESPEEIIGDLKFLMYSLKFSGTSDDYGVPVCTTPTGQNYSACKATGGNTDYATETHKVKVQFLGEPWVISEMSPPTTALTTETSLTNGGYIKLAKESISGIINQGESLPVDDLKFQLDDLEAHGDTTAAIISVIDANGNVLKKDKVSATNTKEFTISGTSYRFHVYKVAPGYTFGAKWADVAIFSKELKLEDGQNLDPDYDDNEYYEVSLGWKNKGASSTATAPDYLRSVLVYSNDIASLSSSGEEKLQANDYIPIVQDPTAWKLTYKGLDISTSDRTYLRYDLERSTAKTLSASHGPLNRTGSTRINCTITAPYVEVKSGGSGAVFQVTSASTGATGSSTSLAATKFIVAISGATCLDANGDFPAPCTFGSTNGNCINGTVFMTLSPSSNDYGLKAYGGNSGNCGEKGNISTTVEFNSAGDGDTSWTEGGLLEFAQYDDATATSNTSCTWMGDERGANTTGHCVASSGNTSGDTHCFGHNRLKVSSGAHAEWYFAFSEKAGVDTSNAFANYHLVGLDLAGADSTFNFDSTASSTGNPYITRKDYELYMYAGPVSTRGTATTGEEGYISERGSVFDDISDTSVRYYVANKLGKAQWYLSSVSTEAAEEGSVIRTLGEGDETTVSGVTIKVMDITETVLPCTVGTGATPACSVDMSGVSAVIMPQDSASVSASIPYDYSKYGNLVILDKDAVGVNTLVSVGGDKVNTVTADLLEGSSVDWATTKKVVREVVQGSKIVVAGAEAEDTLEAAQDFVGEVRRV